MHIYPNLKFWEDDLEVPVNYLLDRFHNTEVRHSWMNSLSGRQLSVIFQHSFKDKLNGQLFDDENYDNTSIQYKRKVIAKHLDSLVIYYLISCFERAKLEATVSEIARSALTTELMKSYLVNNNKYDKKSLLFLLFHADYNLLKSVYHFEKIQRKSFMSFALQKIPRRPSTPFKDFISEEIIQQVLKEDNIKRNDSFENQLQDTVSLVNKKIIKIVSLLKLYCKTKKYFQFTSCIAVYKLVYMLISKLVLCIQDSRNLLINIYTNQLYSINLCKIPFYIR